MEPPLGRRLYLAHRGVHDVLDARMAERGASLWHWVLLKTAVANDGEAQRHLATEMGIEPSTLVRHLDQLAGDGLVERRRDEHDRRVVRVTVTPEGRKRLRELERVVAGLGGEFAALFSPPELRRLGADLDRIREHFGVLKEKEARRVDQH